MPGSSLEHFPNTLTSLGTALDVALRSNLLGDGHTLGPGNRPLVHPGKILDSLAIVAEILLARHKDDWETLTEVKDLGNPLFLHIVKGVGGVNGETDENDMGVGVRKRSESAAA